MNPTNLIIKGNYQLMNHAEALWRWERLAAESDGGCEVLFLFLSQ